VADLPNYFAKYDRFFGGGQVGPSAHAKILSDPAHHLLLQIGERDYAEATNQPADCTAPTRNYSGVNPSTTSEWVTIDSDSYKPIGVACGMPATDAPNTIILSSLQMETAVIDPASQVVFVPCLCGANTAVRTIMAVSETSPEILADFCVATFPGDTCTRPVSADSAALAQPYTYVQSLSWYAPTDDLIVLTDNHSSDGTSVGMAGGAPGVAVTDYHVDRPTSRGIRLIHEWTIHLGPNICQQGLLDPLGIGHSAYRSEVPEDPAVYVPCEAQVGPNVGELGTVVVKVPLGADGRPAGDPLTDPAMKIETVTAPFSGQDFIFDPKSARGYLFPAAPDLTGLTPAVFDGGSRTRPASFITRMRVAQSKYNTVALDDRTGRMYVEDTDLDGLTLVDGRRTPMAPGYPFPSIKAGIKILVYNAAVIPPDERVGYTRLILPAATDDATGPFHMEFFTVLADRVPLSHDAPPNAEDSKTTNGPIPPGATMAGTYRAHAAGYGIHSDSVGGYLGAADNSIPGAHLVNPPYSRTQFDVAAGAVETSSLADGSASATSSSLFDVNGNGARAYRSCTDVLAPGDCQSLALPGTGMSTAQDWPYPIAQCSQPGPPDTRGRQAVSGSRYTQSPYASGGADSAPGHADTPGTHGAVAVADCSNADDGTPRVTSYGQYGCTQSSGAAAGAADTSALECQGPGTTAPLGANQFAPGLLVTTARTETRLLPPAAVGAPSESQVTAFAQGIHLDLPGGVSLALDQVTQVVTARTAGRPGTAHTARAVTIQGLRIQRPGEPAQVYCEAPATCTGDGPLLDLINSVDPAHVYASVPVPNEPFGTEKDGVSPLGSPGGYVARVEASPAQQQGDVQFNQMQGFGGSEKSFVPALRLVLSDPGSATVSRQIVDFAGVEADVEQGIQVEDFGSSNTVDSSQAMIDAGVSPTVGYDPGTLGLPGQPGGGSGYHAGLLGVLERALSGLGWLLRSPLAALQMAGFLTLLGLPLALVRRRWTWQPSAAAGVLR
jgi:hypothetical protein